MNVRKKKKKIKIIVNILLITQLAFTHAWSFVYVCFMKSVDTIVKSIFVLFVHCMLLLLKKYT